MQKAISIVIFCFTLLLVSCKNDDENINNNNPFLTRPPVNISLNLNLPQFNVLNFPSNSVELQNVGISGIVVYSLNTDLYSAFDLVDPNHIPRSCSRMEIDGIIATCPCPDDNNSYDIIGGQHQDNPESSFPMQRYNVRRDGNIITITN